MRYRKGGRFRGRKRVNRGRYGRRRGSLRRRKVPRLLRIGRRM